MKQSAVEFLHSEYKRIIGDTLVDIQKAFAISDSFAKAKEIEEQQTEKVICKHCNKPISVDDINNHLFINIKEGGLIHWNCETF